MVDLIRIGEGKVTW